MFDVRTADKVTLKVRIHAGSAFDPQGKEGLMKLLAANIFPNPEVKEFFAEQLGGSLDIQSNYDYIQVSATAKPESFLTMMETVSTALVNLGIDKETTEKLKARQLERLKSLENDPSYIADQAVAARLLGSFPYGRPDDGTPATISKIDFADLSSARQRFFTADNVTVLVAGKYDQALAFRAVRRYFGSWLKADKLVPSSFRQPDDPPTSVLEISSSVANKPQTRVASRGITKSSPDVFAYQMVAEVLENRLKTAAGGDVRSIDHVLPGIFSISFGIAVDATSLVAKTLATPVSEAEFQAAKAAVVAELEKTDLNDRWLDVDTFRVDTPAKQQAKAAATTLADVQRVFDKIKEQPLATVIVSAAKPAN